MQVHTEVESVCVEVSNCVVFAVLENLQRKPAVDQCGSHTFRGVSRDIGMGGSDWGQIFKHLKLLSLTIINCALLIVILFITIYFNYLFIYYYFIFLNFNYFIILFIILLFFIAK